jgi:glucokinase
MIKKYILGLDIGGTKIEAALFDSKKLNYIRGAKFETPLSPEDFLRCTRTEITALLGKDKLQSIGIGAPGELDLAKGIVLRAINTPAIKGMNLVKKFKDMFNVEVYLDNDVHALALGEALAGEGRDYNSVFAITIGTGVGGGFVYSRGSTSTVQRNRISLRPQEPKEASSRIFEGSTYSATEVGHMIIAAEGAQCICGNRGCLEEYISARAIRRLSGMTPLELERRAKEENPRALFTWSRIGFYLGIGLANIVNLFNPDVILIGGGISKAHKYFLSNAEKIMRNYSISPLSKKKTKIAIIKTPFAGARGAAALAIKSK